MTLDDDLSFLDRKDVFDSLRLVLAQNKLSRLRSLGYIVSMLMEYPFERFFLCVNGVRTHYLVSERARLGFDWSFLMTQCDTHGCSLNSATHISMFISTFEEVLWKWMTEQRMAKKNVSLEFPTNIVPPQQRAILAKPVDPGRMVRLMVQEGRDLDIYIDYRKRYHVEHIVFSHNHRVRLRAFFLHDYIASNGILNRIHQSGYRSGGTDYDPVRRAFADKAGVVKWLRDLLYLEDLRGSHVSCLMGGASIHESHHKKGIA